LNTEWVIRNILAGLIAVAVVSLGGFRSVSRSRVQHAAPATAR
jgi:hypothetical protein